MRRRRLSRVQKELLVAGTVFGTILMVILLWQPTAKITFFDLKIVNDTTRTVKVHPCWDLDCLDTHGLPVSSLSPGGSVHSAGHFPTDAGHELTVGVIKPGGKPWEFSSCLVKQSAPGQLTGVVRVSQAQPCFDVHEP